MAASCTKHLQYIARLVQRLSALEQQITSQNGMETAVQKHEVNTLTAQINAMLLAYERCSRPLQTEQPQQPLAARNA